MLAVPPFFVLQPEETSVFLCRQLPPNKILAEVGRTEVGIEHVEMLLKL